MAQTFKLLAIAETGLPASGAGALTFVRRRRSDGFYWTGAAFEAFVSGNIATYGFASAESGVGTGQYSATDPTPTVEGDYLAVKQAGATLAQTDLTNGRWQDVAGPRTADVEYVLGTAPTAATAGILDVNVKNFNNVIGTTAPNWYTAPDNTDIATLITQVGVLFTTRIPGVVQPQTGDSYARIGAAGVGLTNIGDARIANLDAAVSSRMATYAQPTGFLAATFPSGTIANTTNITAGTIALTATGLDAIVTEAGLNMRQAISLDTAVLCGVLSGAGTTAVTILGAGVGTTRLTSTVDASGDRVSVVLSPPA